MGHYRLELDQRRKSYPPHLYIIGFLNGIGGGSSIYRLSSPITRSFLGIFWPKFDGIYRAPGVVLHR